MDQNLCPFCHAPISEDFFYCPHCGKNIKVSLSISKQIGVYALSIFFPPFGLWPGVKYLFNKDQKVKIVGMIAIVLTIISTIFTIWFTANFISQVNTTLNSQMHQYQILGN